MALLSALLLAAGCSTVGGGGTDCATETDTVTGATFRYCGEAGSFADEIPLRTDGDLLRLIPIQATVGDSEQYYVRLQYQGQTWLYIAPDSQLRISLDGQPFSLKTSTGSRPDSTRQVAGRYGIGVQEAADYATDAGMIRAIGSARIVDLRLEAGPGKAVESRLSGPELEPFRRFVERYLDD